MAKTRKIAESRARYYVRQIAQQKGWNTKHINSNGDFLEEQEVMGAFPDMGLGLERPDFVLCLQKEPCCVIETKNEIGKIDDAINEAIDYSNTINSTGKYNIKIAIGAAGDEETGFVVYVKYLKDNDWISLTSNGYELTTIPSKIEAELALNANDGTTCVSIPSSVEFIESAISLSKILRTAKIEPSLRPKVIGAIVLAMYKGEINTNTSEALSSVNSLVSSTLNEMKKTSGIPEDKCLQLIDALTLSGADFNRLSPFIRRVVSILHRLNIRSVLQTDTDFLGIFYEAFLRYGFDNNSLGIVFTPRHITKFCVDLLNVNATDKIIDIASGTGGFLVSSFDAMMNKAVSPRQIETIKSSLYGFDTNPTIWALANLNLIFRGDGSSHIELGSCFDEDNKNSVYNSFTKAFLNPPFSQEDEPERKFIDTALNALQAEGLLGVVVYAGIFADDEHTNWRKEFCRNHTILGVISLPEDLFYPKAAAPTSILIAKAHVPQNADSEIFMARIDNDGFEKLKNRRIPISGSQLDEVKTCFNKFLNNESFSSKCVTKIKAKDVINGEEWSPQQWSPQPLISDKKLTQLKQSVIKSIFEAVTLIPDLADEALEDFTEAFSTLPDLPLSKKGTITEFFHVVNGKSPGEKNFSTGLCPYVSSGSSCNSIIRLVESEETQCFEYGGITITAFGKASIQPWPFLARGNGGSSVRVLIPKYKMSFNELLWFTTQINMQQWRFFYARQAIKSRLQRLVITSPSENIPDTGDSIYTRITTFKSTLTTLSTL
ncbi:MAG: class I SAM-dependent DNA methyltransferase [Clostridium sp.]